MCFWNKSTRAIVTGKRPAAPDDGQTDGGKRPLWLNPAVWPKWVLPVGIGVGAAVLLIVVIAVIGSLGRPAGTDALPVIGENQAIVSLPADTALTGQTCSGDVVRIYGADGLPVPELQYVQVYKVGDGVLLVLMDDAQTGALVRQDSIGTVALAVHNDEARAAELLALQGRINDPEIRVTLRRALSMAPGEEVTLDYSAEIQPKEAVLPELVWASDNPEVVTVADGTATATSIGTATITLSCGGVDARCAVTVIDLRLSVTEVTLGIGETVQIAADAGEFPVSWSSADTEIATVAEDGTVTGVAPGTTTVTATSEGVSVSCRVTVGYRAEVAQLDAQNMALTVGSTAVLTPAVYPGQDVIDTVVWESSDPAIATVSEDGTVTAVAEGTATVTFRCGAAAASCTVKVEKP